MKKHNFSAGPSILSEYTIKNAAAAVENFAGTGLSILEVSHRGKEFVAVNDEARALIKELLDVPAGYEVVFLGGGASMQFCMVPFNLLNKKLLIWIRGHGPLMRLRKLNYSEKLML